MRKALFFFTALTLMAFYSYAQAYNPIPNGNTVISASPTGTDRDQLCNSCNQVYSFHIGANGVPGSFAYQFTQPVNRIRILLCDVGPNERINLYLNPTGPNYPLTNSQITGVICGTEKIQADGSGTIVGTSNDQNGVIEIAGSFSYIRVQHENGVLGGAKYQILTRTDTPVVFVHPFTDDTLCAGDSVMVPYIVNNTTFPATNRFNVELSEPSGVFGPGSTTIGTVQSNATGTIRCRIPTTQPGGTNYRLRIRATSNNFTVINNLPIVINRFAVRPFAAVANDSVCEGTAIELETKYYTPDIFNSWIDPKGASFGAPAGAKYPTAPSTLDMAGDYILIARLGACQVRDTVNVKVFINPPIKSISHNAPLCERDTLYVTLEDTVGLPIKYQWSKPSGAVDTAKNPIVYGITKADSGIFYLKSTLGICSSYDTTSVEINTKPADVSITTNSPVFPGNELTFQANTSTPGVTLAWTGPDSFYDTIPNPKIPQASILANGTYTLTVTIGNCSTLASAIVVVQQMNGRSMNIYPSPTTGTLNLRGVTVTDQIIPLIISDISGNIIWEDSIDVKKRLVQKVITLPGALTNGTYILKMKVDGEYESYKIILNK